MSLRIVGLQRRNGSMGVLNDALILDVAVTLGL